MISMCYLTLHRKKKSVSISGLDAFSGLFGIHFFKCHEFTFHLTKWSNKDWIYLLPKIKNETKQDKTYETSGFRQLMSGNENEREQSLRNRNKVSPSPIPWELPDHGTGKGNRDGIEPIPRVGQMKSKRSRGL